MKWTRIIFEEDGCKGKTFDSKEEIINFEREEKLDYILNDSQISDYYKSLKIEILPEYDNPESGKTGGNGESKIVQWWEY